MEEAILHIGQELINLKVRLALRCHKKYRWICVTPLKVNKSLYSWEQIQTHILGVWNHSDLSLDLEKLHQKIYDIGNAQLDDSPAETAQSFFDSLRSFLSQRTLFTLFTNIGIIAAIILILAFLLPVIFRILSKSIHQVSIELHSELLKNENGGNVGSQPGASVP